MFFSHTQSLFVLIMLMCMGMVLGLPFTTSASTDARTAFRMYTTVSPGAIVVPTVVEVPVRKGTAPRSDYYVVRERTGVAIPSYYIPSFETAPTLYSVSTEGSGEGYALNDGNLNSYVRYDLKGSGIGSGRITLSSAVPITASQLNLLIGDRAFLPQTVAITARDANGVETIVRSSAPVTSEVVTFIPTSGTLWTIDFTYTQPMTITEAVLVEETPLVMEKSVLRFLAQPGETYTVYADGDTWVPTPMGDGGALYSETNTLRLAPVVFFPNAQYVPSDSDGDGVADARDNCPMHPNSDQFDIDVNGVGDVCDDYDRDGYYNTDDNCPNVANTSQRDEDGDGIGDECDSRESRFTERLPWVPWVGMGIAVLVLLGLFIFVAIDMRNKKPMV